MNWNIFGKILHSKSKQELFENELEQLVSKVNSINEIKWIAEREKKPIKEHNENIEKKISELKKDIIALKRKCITCRIQSEKCWKMIWRILVIYAICACILLLASAIYAICAKESYVFLEIGGILVLVILAIIIIFLGNQVKTILTHEKEQS